MALYWDENESSLSLELSVTKNAGKQSFFFFFFLYFHAVGCRLTLPGFLMPMTYHETSLLCSLVWVRLTVLPTAAASPGHLCQHQDHTQCWASASNSLPLWTSPTACPEAALDALNPSLLWPSMLYCSVQEADGGRALPRQGMQQSWGTDVRPWTLHGTYRTGAPDDRQRRECSFPVKSWAFSFLLHFPTKL